jgi:FHA domain-containing protein
MSTPLRLITSDGAPIEIERERVLLGREPSCDVVLEDKSVSRRHLLVERRGTRWHVVDQGSANGTFVDGQPVTEADLFDGQELRLGTLSLWVQLEEEAPATVLMAAPELSAGPPPTTVMPSPVRPAPAPAAASAPPPVSPPADAARGAREEAAALLGLPATASPYEVSARYEELSRDLQEKLASARTPNLRATYERNLQEIRQAGERLAPGFAPAVSTADLPSAQPVVVAEASESLFEPPRAVAPREAAASAPAGPSSITTTAAAVVVVMLGLTGYFLMSKQKNDKALLTMRKSSELATARADSIKYQPFDELEKSGALVNGKLKLCNRASQTLEIPWLGAVYLDDRSAATTASDAFIPKAYNSDFCRHEFSLAIPAGAEKEISLSGNSEKCQWSGQGLFYALAIRRPASVPSEPEPAPEPAAGKRKQPPKESISAAPEPLVFVSGLLNNRHDCVTIGQGW